MALDTRHKDRNWNLPTRDNGAIETWDAIKIAVLMDIRDEMQKLNNLLGCPNFTGIPRSLTAIRRNTAKPRRRKR